MLDANVKIALTEKGATWEAGLEVVCLSHGGRFWWHVIKDGLDVYANLDFTTTFDTAARMIVDARKKKPETDD